MATASIYARSSAIRERKSSLLRRRRISGWSPTPRRVVVEALRLAEVGPQDLVYDLGCGDGRVLERAGKLFGARAVGFDIDEKRIKEARELVVRSRIKRRVWLRREDLLSIPDLGRATVVYLYLPQLAVNRLLPKLKQSCRKGTRVVSVATWIYRWTPEKQLTIMFNDQRWNIGLWVL